MSGVQKLFKAIKNKNTSEIIRLMHEENIDLNEIHPLYKMRAIDFAASRGDLKIVKFLKKYGAVITTSPDSPSFLYWLSCCHNYNLKVELFNWLISDEHYQELGDNIDIDHLNAASGNDYNYKNITTHGGLTSLDYALLAENSYANNYLIRKNLLNKKIKEGYFTGVTRAWLLIENQQIRYFKELNDDCDEGVNLNVYPTHQNNSLINVTLASLLVEQNEDKLLEELIFESQSINVNALTRSGITLLTTLVKAGKWELINLCARYNVEPYQLNVRPIYADDPDEGVTLAWELIFNRQFAALKFFKKHSRDLLDLDAAPMHSNHMQKEVTVALLLALYNQYDDFKEWLIENDYKVNLKASASHPNHPFYNQMLIIIMLEKGHWDLVELSLLAYFRHYQNAEERLDELASVIPLEQWEIHNLIHFVCIREYRHQFFHHSFSSKNKEEQVDFFNKLFARIDKIAVDSFYYKIVQQFKGEILAKLALSIANIEPVVVTVKDNQPKLYTVSDRNTLLINAVSSYAKAGNSVEVKFELAKQLLYKEKLKQRRRGNIPRSMVCSSLFAPISLDNIDTEETLTPNAPINNGELDFALIVNLTESSNWDLLEETLESFLNYSNARQLVEELVEKNTKYNISKKLTNLIHLLSVKFYAQEIDNIISSVDEESIGEEIVDFFKGLLELIDKIDGDYYHKAQKIKANIISNVISHGKSLSIFADCLYNENDVFRNLPAKILLNIAMINAFGKSGDSNEMKPILQEYFHEMEKLEEESEKDSTEERNKFYFFPEQPTNLTTRTNNENSNNDSPHESNNGF